MVITPGRGQKRRMKWDHWEGLDTLGFTQGLCNLCYAALCSSKGEPLLSLLARVSAPGLRQQDKQQRKHIAQITTHSTSAPRVPRPLPGQCKGWQQRTPWRLHWAQRKEGRVEAALGLKELLGNSWTWGTWLVFWKQQGEPFPLQMAYLNAYLL